MLETLSADLYIAKLPKEQPNFCVKCEWIQNRGRSNTQRDTEQTGGMDQVQKNLRRMVLSMY